MSIMPKRTRRTGSSSSATATIWNMSRSFSGWSSVVGGSVEGDPLHAQLDRALRRPADDVPVVPGIERAGLEDARTLKEAKDMLKYGFFLRTGENHELIAHLERIGLLSAPALAESNNN